MYIFPVGVGNRQEAMACPLQTGRYAARLAALPPDALLALALKGCEET